MDLKNIRPITGHGRKIYIETYGCQMNLNDSEVVVSIMQNDGWTHTDDISQADIVLINTCSVRDSAEQRIWARLGDLNRIKKERKKERKANMIVGVIGCMAERLKEELIERNKVVDIIAGPDSYRDLPMLVRSVEDGGRGVNVMLSAEETYGEISPVRLDKNGISAFISIMRGCNNMCSYCVVPFTRGRERSRDPHTIIEEARQLFDAGYREVTLLGQNVNSYFWMGGESIDFPTLLKLVAQIDPKLRVRFSTSHPKDLSDKVLDIMVDMPNICRNIHLPAQSGSSRMLGLMNRKYTREWYLERIAAIKKRLPDCSVTTDIIAGFCGETDDDHAQTLSLMREVEYAFSYMYKYSERPDTKASKTMADDVPDQVKGARLSQIIELQRELSLKSNREDIGKQFEVLIDSVSKRSESRLSGRTGQNKVVVIDRGNHSLGDYVMVKITDCSRATLFGEVL